MGLLGTATEKVQYELIPMAEYVFTLWDLMLDTGQYGDQVKWVWLVSPVNNPDAYIKRNDGQEKEVWQFSKPGLPKGSRAREWVEALLGRELRTGEEPDDTDLLRRRMVAQLVHKANKNDPSIKREAIYEGSARSFSSAKPTAVPGNATDEQIDAAVKASDEWRDEMYRKIKTAIKNAGLADIDTDSWASVDLKKQTDADLETMLSMIKDAIRQAA